MVNILPVQELKARFHGLWSQTQAIQTKETTEEP